MARYEEVIKQMQNGQFAPLYVIYGEEPLYVDKIARYAESHIIDEANRDFNQSVFYAKDTSIEEVLSCAKEFPFGVEKRLVIVKEAQNWSNLSLLKSYSANPSPTTILIVCIKYSTLKDTKGWGKSTVFCLSAKVADWNLGQFVVDCARTHGYNISFDSANLMAEHIGNDLSRIDNEFEKLKLQVPAGATITGDIIETYIGISKQYNIYELIDALVARDEAKAYKIVDVFSRNLNNNPLIKTIASVGMYYQKILCYHLLPHKNPEELALIFNPKWSPQKQSREISIANRYSVQTLLNIVSALRELDAKAKGCDNVAGHDQLYKELVYRILH